MNKTELLADIESKAVKVIETYEEPDQKKNDANVRMYITNIMQQKGDQIEGKNIGWYTIDEGTGNEQAFYRDVPTPKSQARDAVVAYLDTLTPATYIRYNKQSLAVDENDRSATVKAIKDNGDGTGTQVNLFIYKNGSNPIAHVELA